MNYTSFYRTTTFGPTSFVQYSRVTDGSLTFFNHTNVTSGAGVISEEEMEERKVTALIFGIFSSLGVLLNATPLLLTYCTSLHHNVVHIFVSNLSAADFLLSACFLFGNTLYVLYRHQISNLGCRLLGMIIFVTAYQEFVFPPLLSINRYIALYHQHVYNKVYTKWSMCGIIAGSWVLCAVMPTIFFIFHKTGYDTDNEHCCVTVNGSQNTNNNWIVIYWVVVIVPLVVFCDGTMLFCNTKMYKKLHDQTGGAESMKSSSMRRNRELMWFLWADMTLPICFHTVYHVLKFVIHDRSQVGVRRFFAMLYLMNSCMRGTLTLTLLRPYRVALRNLVCFFWKPKNTVVPMAATATGPPMAATTTGH